MPPLQAPAKHVETVDGTASSPEDRSAGTRRSLEGIRAHVRQPLFRNAYALMISTAATGAVGVLFWGLAAHRYSATAVGENGALISAMMTVSTFAQLDLASTMMRFLPWWRAASTRAVTLAYSVSTAAAVVLGVGFAVAAPRLRHNLAFLHSGQMGLAFCLAVVAWGVFAIQDGVLTGLGRATVVPVENTSFGIAKLALLVGVSGLLPRWGIFVAWTIPVALSLPPVNYLIFRRYLPRHHERPAPATPLDRRTIVRYMAYDYAGGLCGALTTMALPLLVISLLGAKANAHFYIAWTLVLIVDTVGLSLGSSLLVEGSYEPGQLAAYGRQVLRRGALLLVPTTLVVLVGAPLLLAVFGHGYSAASSTALRILILGVIPRAILILYTSIARVQGDVHRVLVAVLLATVLILVLVVTLGRGHGLVGVAAGWVIGYAAVAVAILPWLIAALRGGTETA